MEARNALRVSLGDVPVGVLTLNANQGCEFRLLESYKNAYPRPILGQVFMDDLGKGHSSRSRTPPWFSNLLPEGQLRQLIADQAGVSSAREFFLLYHLREDLPGAVRIVAEEQAMLAEASESIGEQRPSLAAPEDDAWHFSLAGVQLKFSARQGERGLTVPVSGLGGDWIIKLPDARYPKVPENEFATMQWARSSLIDVPEFRLVDVADVTGLPPALQSFSEKKAFAIRRFDRLQQGHRVHMEDFAQILNLYPEEKYKKYNYETLASVIMGLTGSAGLDEFVRRLIFVIASGNGDAHHKNWSLVYPDGVNAALSPAYDLVSTIQYMRDDQLALNLAGSKRWQDVDMNVFRRMARKIGEREALMVSRVEASVEAVLDAWHTSSCVFGYDAAAIACIEDHLSTVPLFRKR